MGIRQERLYDMPSSLLPAACMWKIPPDFSIRNTLVKSKKSGDEYPYFNSETVAYQQTVLNETDALAYQKNKQKRGLNENIENVYTWDLDQFYLKMRQCVQLVITLLSQAIVQARNEVQYVSMPYAKLIKKLMRCYLEGMHSYKCKVLTEAHVKKGTLAPERVDVIVKITVDRYCDQEKKPPKYYTPRGFVFLVEFKNVNDWTKLVKKNNGKEHTPATYMQERMRKWNVSNPETPAFQGILVNVNLQRHTTYQHWKSLNATSDSIQDEDHVEIHEPITIKYSPQLAKVLLRNFQFGCMHENNADWMRAFEDGTMQEDGSQRWLNDAMRNKLTDWLRLDKQRQQTQPLAKSSQAMQDVDIPVSQTQPMSQLHETETQQAIAVTSEDVSGNIKDKIVADIFQSGLEEADVVVKLATQERRSLTEPIERKLNEISSDQRQKLDTQLKIDGLCDTEYKAYYIFVNEKKILRNSVLRANPGQIGEWFKVKLGNFNGYVVLHRGMLPITQVQQWTRHGLCRNGQIEIKSFANGIFNIQHKIIKNMVDTKELSIKWAILENEWLEALTAKSRDLWQKWFAKTFAKAMETWLAHDGGQTKIEVKREIVDQYDWLQKVDPKSYKNQMEISDQEDDMDDAAGGYASEASNGHNMEEGDVGISMGAQAEPSDSQKLWDLIMRARAYASMTTGHPDEIKDVMTAAFMMQNIKGMYDGDIKEVKPMYMAVVAGEDAFKKSDAYSLPMPVSMQEALQSEQSSTQRAKSINDILMKQEDTNIKTEAWRQAIYTTFCANHPRKEDYHDPLPDVGLKNLKKRLLKITKLQIPKAVRGAFQGIFDQWVEQQDIDFDGLNNMI